MTNLLGPPSLLSLLNPGHRKGRRQFVTRQFVARQLVARWRILRWLLVLFSLGSGLPVAAQTPSLLQTLLDNPYLLLADRIIGTQNGEQITFIGRVRLTQGTQFVTSDRALVTPNLIRVDGEVRLFNGVQALQAEEIQLDRQTGTLSLRQGRITEDFTVMTLGQAQERSDGQVVTDDFLFAACADCSQVSRPPWALKARQATYDPKTEQIRLETLRLEVLGTPVLQLPAWQVANPRIPRLTGLLQPKLRTSEAGGMAVTLGYFLDLGTQQDLTLATRAHRRGAVEFETRYRFADATRSLNLTARTFALDEGGKAYTSLGAGKASASDLEVSGDWFLSPKARIRVGGRWETAQGLGVKFGHDSGDYRLGELVYERFGNDRFARWRLTEDRQSATVASGLTQGQAPQTLQGRYERYALPAGQIGGQKLTANGLLTLDVAERSAGRDRARLALRGALALPPQVWQGQEWSAHLLAAGGVSHADGLDTTSDAFTPDSPNFSGQSTFATYGLSVETALPLTRRAGQGQMRLRPALRLSHLAGDPPDSTWANEDALLSYLSASSLFAPPESLPLDRSDQGTRLDLGTSWAWAGKHWTTSGFTGQRLQDSPPLGASQAAGNANQQSALLTQGRLTFVEPQLNLQYWGRNPVEAGQARSQYYALSLPTGRWQTTATFIEQEATEALSAGRQAQVSAQGPLHHNWRGTISLSDNRLVNDDRAATVTATYADCCLGLELSYDYAQNQGEREQSLRFEFELLGLTTPNNRD